MYGVTDTDLVYNIVESVLTGKIDDTAISAQVVSGGRAGSTMSGVVNPFLAGNPFATRVKATSKTPGGPLILGRYSLQTHESRTNWIRLIPAASNFMSGRDGFAIHGRGPHGSDGCLVPTDFAVVTLLCKLVKSREKDRRPAATLTVVAIGDIDFIEKRLQSMKTIA